jgi:hypothetical protein
MLTLLRVHFHFPAFCIGLPADCLTGPAAPWPSRPSPFGRKAAGRVVASLRSAPARTSPAALSGL